MKIKICCIMLFSGFSLYAQDYSSLKNKADLLSSYEEYGMAIVMYDSLLSIAPDSTDLWSSLGICYMKNAQAEKAISCFKQYLRSEPENNEIFLELGNSYDMINNSDSAVYYYKKYILKRPSHPEAYNRLSSIYMNQTGQEDSAIFFARKALDCDPLNPSSYLSLSFAYFSKSEFSESLKTAKTGLDIDSAYHYLLLPAGLSAFYLDEYKAAREYFKKGWESKGYEEYFNDYYAQSIIMYNTHPGKFEKSGEKIYFSEIKSENLESLLSQTRNPDSEYYYPKLLRKSKDQLFDMGLDDFMMLYIGFTNDAAYAPYSTDNTEIFKLLDNEDSENFRLKAEEMTGMIPVNFPLYLYLSEIYKEKGNYQAQLENMIMYMGFTQAIQATGTGKSKKEAIIITYINHEYDIIRELGLISGGQSLLSDKYMYDLIKAIDASEKEHDIYFNIHIPFSTLSSGFESKPEKRKKSKSNPNIN